MICRCADAQHGRWHRILVIAPHLDDECWSGALLAREKCEKHVLYLTSGPYRSVDLDVIRAENLRSMAIAKLTQHHLHMAPYRLDQDRERLRQGIHGVVGNLKPDLVLIPCSADYHQDHAAAHDEAMRVMHGMDVDVLGYLVPTNGHPLRTHRARVMDIHMSVKQAMIDCYVSQGFRGRTSVGDEERYEVLKWRI